MYVCKRTRCLRTSTHALSSLALTCEKLFSAFKRRRVYAEKCWNVGITRACVCVGVYTRERTPAFDCILRIYSGQRIYARRVRDLPFLLFFFSLSLPPPSNSFPISMDRTRRHNVMFIESLTPNCARIGIYAISIFGPSNFRRYTDNPWKSGNFQNSVGSWRCLRSESYATTFRVQWNLTPIAKYAIV